MRFAEKGYYIEQYVKCANCGMLIYGEALDGKLGDQPAVFCSEWCREWPSLRETWTEQSRPPER
jgi:N-methylhydantoinase B